MQNKIYDTLFGLLPSKRKLVPSGWISFSGSCCVHNNETQDKKGRAGITGGADGICYHCFNCGSQAHWKTVVGILHIKLESCYSGLVQMKKQLKVFPN